MNTDRITRTKSGAKIRMTDGEFGAAMATLNRLLSSLDQEWHRHQQAVAATNRRRAIARVEALRARVVEAHELRDAIREDLAECEPDERPALTREFNAAGAKLIAVNGEIADLVRQYIR